MGVIAYILFAHLVCWVHATDVS